MLSTPIFEQLCRELVGSGEPEEACAEASETGADNQKSTTCPEQAIGNAPGREPECDPGAEPVSAAELDAEPDAEPETAAGSVPEAEPEVGWTAPEERVA